MNMNIKAKIAIMGAGAMGSVIGGMLARQGHMVTLVGRQQHMDAILKKGLHISGIWGEYTVYDLKTTTTPSNEPHDIIFLTVKSFDTATAAREALTMVGPDTVVVSIQNGLGNIETLCEIFGKERIIGGMAIFGAIVHKPSSVEVTAIASETLVGEIDVSVTHRVQSISRMLDSAGIPTKVSGNIMRDIWNKVLYNLALNPLSAIFQVSYGQIAENIHTRWLVQQMISEAFQVANVLDIDLGIDSPDVYLEILWNQKLPLTREHKSSMLQDIMHGKRTEIDYINGAIMQLGAEYGIETPYNSAIVKMVKAKEALGAVKA
jgi:2-dehydropantoate 2-reductase